MRLISTKKLTEGMMVGKQVFTGDGRVLLQSNIQLTSEYIALLKEKQIPCIYVIDDISKEVEAEQTIDPELQIRALQTIKSLMKDIAPQGRNITRKNRMFLTKHMVLQIKGIVTDIIESLRENKGSLVRLVELMGTDVYTYNHSVNVAIISLMIGIDYLQAISKREKEEKLMALGFGAMLHDIGKSMVPPSILNKPDKLTPEEYEMAKRHVLYGYDMIKDNHEINQMKYAGIVKGCVLLHHENLDGTGYPHGLKGDQIQDYMRIIRVADIYTAMIADRAYKDRIPAYQALEQISAMCFSKIDTGVFLSLRDQLALYPEGTGVLMNTGEKGIVTKNNEDRSDRPIVKIIYDTEGNRHKGFRVVDMMQERTYFVEDTIEL